MKRTFSLLALILAVSMLLCSCGGGGGAAKVVSSGDGAVVIEALDSTGSLEDALNALSEAGELEFSGTVSEYGLYIESVNGVSANPENQYWAIYTTLGDLDGIGYSSPDFGTYDYDGKTLSSASFGASGLPLVEGELYALVLSEF